MPPQRIFCCRGYAVARAKAGPFRRFNGGIGMVCASEGRGDRPATRIRMTQTSQHSSSPSKASGTLKFMLQRFMESICLTNASCRYLLFQ